MDDIEPRDLVHACALLGSLSLPIDGGMNGKMMRVKETQYIGGV